MNIGRLSIFFFLVFFYILQQFKIFMTEAIHLGPSLDLFLDILFSWGNYEWECVHDRPSLYIYFWCVEKLLICASRFCMLPRCWICLPFQEVFW